MNDWSWSWSLNKKKTKKQNKTEKKIHQGLVAGVLRKRDLDRKKINGCELWVWCVFCSVGGMDCVVSQNDGDGKSQNERQKQKKRMVTEAQNHSKDFFGQLLHIVIVKWGFSP